MPSNIFIFKLQVAMIRFFGRILLSLMAIGEILSALIRVELKSLDSNYVTLSVKLPHPLFVLYLNKTPYKITVFSSEHWRIINLFAPAVSKLITNEEKQADLTYDSQNSNEFRPILNTHTERAIRNPGDFVSKRNFVLLNLHIFVWNKPKKKICKKRVKYTLKYKINKVFSCHDRQKFGIYSFKIKRRS